MSIYTLVESENKSVQFRSIAVDQHKYHFTTKVILKILPKAIRTPNALVGRLFTSWNNRVYVFTSACTNVLAK